MRPHLSTTLIAMKSLAQLAYLQVPTSDIPFTTDRSHATVGRLDHERIEKLEFELCMGKFTLHDRLVSGIGYDPQQTCEHCYRIVQDPDEPYYNNCCGYHFLEYQSASGPIICWGDVNEWYIKTCLNHEMCMCLCSVDNVSKSEVDSRPYVGS